MTDHTLEIYPSRNYGGYYEGICQECFDVDWDGERYVSEGSYWGREIEDVEESFRDHHETLGAR